MNKAELLLKRRNHRGDARSYVINFLSNFSEYARFMREFVPIRAEKQDVLQVAMRAYIIGMAACLETFFRDLYLHLLERDPHFAQRALALNPRRDRDAAIDRYVAEGVPVSELAAAQVSFQSAEAIDRNFSIFFTNETFFEALADFELICAIPSVNKAGTGPDEAFCGMAGPTRSDICVASRICPRWQFEDRN
jgi:hypothetical protein